MAFITQPGIKGKIYIPDHDPAGCKKHNCNDCFSCQVCSDDRCNLCRSRGIHLSDTERNCDNR
jgi:hypothetical protein